MRLATALATLLTLLAATSPAATAEQTDWSGGPGAPGPVEAWAADFATAASLSWRSVPGQLALSSVPLASPRQHLVADGQAGAYGLQVADLDSDGHLDVIGTAQTARDLLVWFNSGANPPTWSAQTVDGDVSGISSVRAADLDADGDLDLVAAGNRVTWWRNDGGSPPVWTTFLVDYFVPVACNVQVADVDSDGDLDILGSSYSRGEAAWWRNDGGEPLAWVKQQLATTLPGAHSVEPADLDGDGDTDLVAVGAEVDTVVAFLNSGGDPVTWTEQVLSTTMPGVRYAVAGDLDDDGRVDVVAVDWGGALRWWHNDGGSPPAWSEHLVADDCLQGHWVNLADVDGDGWLDLLVVAYGRPEIAWFESDGGALATWTRHPVVTGGFGPLTAVAGDLDSDGDLDLVGSDFQGGRFAWWEVGSFVEEGSLDSAVLDLGYGRDRLELDWAAVAPAATTLAVAARSGDDPSDLGPWGETLAAPGALPGEVGRYLQLRVTMTSADPDRSPVLDRLGVTAGGEGSCVPGDTVLCLNRGRFRCEMTWRDHAGATGSARVAPVGSDTSGLYWFFGADNWEVLLKVLDGCGVNGHYWVFAAATTDVGFELSVVDTETGEERAYSNPVGLAAPALTDTTAFATCP